MSKKLREEHRMNDTISRQVVIDAILAVTGNSTVRELYEHVQEHGLSEMWSGGVNAAIDIIIALPSVQTTNCEGCKHLGKWENEVEYGYPSPCTRCKRRVGDHYER